MMKNNPAFDAIIVGAGVIGCSIAYHLASAGLKVALLDQGQVGAGASGANSGLVQSNDVELQHSIPLVAAGFSRFQTLEEELGMSVGFERTGILHLLSGEEHWQSSLERTNALSKAGIACEMLNPGQASKVEPLLDPHTMIGAMYAPDQGRINPFRLMWAFLRQANRMGLSLHTFTRVTGFDIQSGRVQGVQTDRGSYSAGRIILATAAWTRRLGNIIAQDWKINTFRASAMVTEPVHDRRLRTVITAADHVELKLDDRGDIELAFLGLRQTPDGNFLIAQSDRPGEALDSSISSQAPRAMATVAARYFPFLRQVRLLRSWTAPTTYTEDGCPFIGPVPGLDGLLMATAFRSSLINSPVAGEIIAGLVLNGRCDLLDIRPFALDRTMGSADTFYAVKGSG